jgi:hypothetical protein
MVVGSFKPKRKPKALTEKERLEQRKKMVQNASFILSSNNEIGNIFRMLLKSGF